MGYILFFGLLTVIAFGMKLNPIGILLLVITIGIIVYHVYTSQKKKRLLKENMRKEQERKLAEEIELNTVIIPAYNKSRSELVHKYGFPTKIFTLKPHDLNREIIAFEESKRVWICGRDFHMKDILSCSVVDNPEVIKGKLMSTTQTDNGSMIKRALVGDVLFGSAGAIIGGATSSTTTTTTQESDKVYHDYSVIVNVNDIGQPIIKIHIGNDVELTNEIVGLMNVIINRK